MTKTTSTESSRADLSQFVEESHWRTAAPAARRILLVFAHPDDESFGNAGTIVRYALAGVDVHYACATRGECGTVDPQLLKEKGIAALRSAEMAHAADVLGLASYHFLGYRDSGMPGSPENEHPQAFCAAPLERVTGQITGLIRGLRPHIVITFNPYGGYGHPDHIMAHHATLAAFRAAADTARFPEQLTTTLAPWQPNKLYYTSFGTGFLKTSVALARLMGRDPRRFGQNQDIDLTRVIAETTPITTVINSGDFLVQKEQAWAAHASQDDGRGPMKKLPAFIRRRMFANEAFTRVIPAWPGGQHENDLFAGIPFGAP